MNARERLRQFLEQRRELGESELVLDRMSVDEVLRIVGAGGGPTSQPAPPAAGRSAPGAGGGAAGGEAPVGGAGIPDARAADDVVAPADHPRLRGVGEPGVQDLPPRSALVPEMVERPVADPALADAAERGDWRTALRAAGSGPDGAVAGGGSGEQEDAMARRATRGGGAGDGGAAGAGSAGPEVGGGEGEDEGEQPGAGMDASPAPGAAAVADAALGRRASAHPVPATGSPFPGTDIPVGLVVGEAAALFGGPFDHLATLDDVARTVRECTRCPLYKTATHGVPGEGNPNADFVVVGEAPGAEEDATGRPFVGASGQLLTRILSAINLAREDVFICNVVKHRPPGNRNPAPNEVEACSPYLVRQLELVRPKVILTVGNFAAQTLLNTKLGIGKLRGQVHLYRGVPLVATYHPAALLRNPAWKRPTWEDVQLARRLLDRAATG